MVRMIIAVAGLFAFAQTHAQDPKSDLQSAFDAVEPKVIAWRRDLHQNPELSNREFRTSARWDSTTLEQRSHTPALSQHWLVASPDR